MPINGKKHICQYAPKAPTQKPTKKCRSTPSLHRPPTQLDPSGQHQHCTKQSRRRSPRLRRNISTAVSGLQRTSNRPIKPLALSGRSNSTSFQTHGPVNAANDTVANAIPNLVPTMFRFGVRLATHVGIRHWNAPLMMP